MVTEPVGAICGGPPIHTDHQVAVQENLVGGVVGPNNGILNCTPSEGKKAVVGTQVDGSDQSKSKPSLNSGNTYREILHATRPPHWTANAVPAGTMSAVFCHCVLSGTQARPRDPLDRQISMSPRKAKVGGRLFFRLRQ